jgi:hypothetical protein
MSTPAFSLSFGASPPLVIKALEVPFYQRYRRAASAGNQLVLLLHGERDHSQDLLDLIASVGLRLESDEAIGLSQTLLTCTT